MCHWLLTLTRACPAMSEEANSDNMKALSVAELLKEADLSLGGSSKWSDQIPERSSGIYIITIADQLTPPLTALPQSLRHRWNPGEEIVYIGRSVNLRRRLSQFYRHIHGHSRPHRGGEDITLLGCQKYVFWARASNHAAAERRLLEIFKSGVGQMPFGNRVRSARLHSTQ